jgi:hypothetical protein
MSKSFVAAVIGAMGVLSFAASSYAAPSIQILNNSGTWRDTVYGAGISTSVTTKDVFNVSITPVTGGWRLDLAPTSAFLAQADNKVGGERQTYDGGLSLVINFGTPLHLLTTLSEQGVYSSTGNGTYSDSGWVIISEADHASPVEAVNHIFSTPIYADGFWQVNDQFSGFNDKYSSYRISLDDILEATSLAATSPGSALIAKKEFSFIFTDGGGDPAPEPATLGVLATGCLALLARRRRV